jgi:hypothetical protein
MSYQILLGRDPENSTVMAAGTTQTIAAVMRGLFQSAEFSSCVAQQLAEEAPPRHDVFSDRPTPEQIAWLLDKIATTPKTKARLRTAADWSSFMGLCLVLLPSAIAKSNIMRGTRLAEPQPHRPSTRPGPRPASSPPPEVATHEGFANQFW